MVIRFDGAATTTSGAPYRNQFVCIFHQRDGVVTEAEAFLDLFADQHVVENNAPRARSPAVRLRLRSGPRHATSRCRGSFAHGQAKRCEFTHAATP
jgi:hypothetical protein